jgi:hypothetical protein
LAAILAIYIFRLGTLKDGLVAAFMTYIFADGILGTIGLATLYFASEPYPSFNVDIWTMLSHSFGGHRRDCGLHRSMACPKKETSPRIAASYAVSVATCISPSLGLSLIIQTRT